MPWMKTCVLNWNLHLEVYNLCLHACNESVLSCTSMHYMNNMALTGLLNVLNRHRSRSRYSITILKYSINPSLLHSILQRNVNMSIVGGISSSVYMISLYDKCHYLKLKMQLWSRIYVFIFKYQSN